MPISEVEPRLSFAADIPRWEGARADGPGEELCEYAAMMKPDWGMSDPPHSFSQGGWPLTQPVYSDQADDLPEIMAARAGGYFPAPDDPLW